MILRQNIPEIVRRALAFERVLDVGGWHCPLNVATHVIDLRDYYSRQVHEALDPDDPERFRADTWTVHDVCRAPWPFPDNLFEFSVCSHLLEDIADPFTVCRELMRVSKAGYIETPSRDREIFCKARFGRLRFLIGKRPEVGFAHHRWFVERDGERLIFTAKYPDLTHNLDAIITRSEIGRKLSEAESGIGLFWTGSFPFEHRDATPADHEAYKLDALARLSVGTNRP
ncbi:MAG TPA: methyltransferase domain-containing protein [Alphaproteobacteria bacterium]|nr:methyltransferase domain-containing protein [Alphaproteobacteria bacterium]